MISKEQIRASLNNPRQNFYRAVEDLYNYCIQREVYPLLINYIMQRAKAQKKLPNEMQLIGFLYVYLKDIVDKSMFGKNDYQAQMFVKTLWSYKAFNAMIYKQARLGYKELEIPETDLKKIEAETTRLRLEEQAEKMRISKKQKKCVKCERTTCVNRIVAWDGESKLKQKSVPSCFVEKKVVTAQARVQDIVQVKVPETQEEEEARLRYKGRKLSPEELQIIEDLRRIR
jgi:hypothetical protein